MNREHRLYVHMSEPVRFLGLTTVELLLGLGGLLGVIFNTHHLGMGTLCLISGWGSIIVLRQSKKHKLGGHLRSALTWYGVLLSPSPHWPAFPHRRWVG